MGDTFIPVVSGNGVSGYWNLNPEGGSCIQGKPPSRAKTQEKPTPPIPAESKGLSLGGLILGGIGSNCGVEMADSAENTCRNNNALPTPAPYQQGVTYDTETLENGLFYIGETEAKFVFDAGLKHCNGTTDGFIFEWDFGDGTAPLRLAPGGQITLTRANGEEEIFKYEDLVKEKEYPSGKGLSLTMYHIFQNESSRVKLYVTTTKKGMNDHNEPYSTEELSDRITPRPSECQYRHNKPFAPQPEPTQGSLNGNGEVNFMAPVRFETTEPMDCDGEEPADLTVKFYIDNNEIPPEDIHEKADGGYYVNLIFNSPGWHELKIEVVDNARDGIKAEGIKGFNVASGNCSPAPTMYGVETSTVDSTDDKAYVCESWKEFKFDTIISSQCPTADGLELIIPADELKFNMTFGDYTDNLEFELPADLSERLSNNPTYTDLFFTPDGMTRVDLKVTLQEETLGDSTVNIHYVDFTIQHMFKGKSEYVRATIENKNGGRLDKTWQEYGNDLNLVEDIPNIPDRAAVSFDPAIDLHNLAVGDTLRASAVPQLDNATYRWLKSDAPDGIYQEISSDPNLEYELTEAGTFLLKLEVEKEVVAPDRTTCFTKVLESYPATPITVNLYTDLPYLRYFTADPSHCLPSASACDIRFNAEVIAAEGRTIENLYLDFADGSPPYESNPGTPIANLEDVPHTYEIDGMYYVKLIATDNTGATREQVIVVNATWE